MGRTGYIIYNDTEPHRPFTGRMPSPNSAYIRHYSNLLELDRAITLTHTDGLPRYQAEKEIRICLAKLEWWSKRPGFDLQAVLPAVLELKKLWASTRTTPH